MAAARGRRRLPRRIPAGRHPPPGLRLRRRRRARAAAALSLDLGLRPDRAARRAAGDGSGAAGLYRPDDRESRRGRHPASRAGDRGRHVDRALCLPGAVGRALRAARRDARPLHRRQPDAGGDRAAVDPADGLPSRGRHHEAGRRAGRRVPDRRRLDVDRWPSTTATGGALCAAMQHAGAGRRSALRHAGRCGWPTSGALRHRAAGARGRAVGGVEQAADRGAPDARAAEQLRRVPRPAARARDRPDPVAHPGRPQPAGAGARPARHAAPGRGNAARHGPRHRPAHRR